MNIVLITFESCGHQMIQKKTKQNWMSLIFQNSFGRLQLYNILFKMDAQKKKTLHFILNIMIELETRN